MRPIVWRPAAREDLLEIVTYIAERNPAAARRIGRLIEDAILPLR
jgi:toxin ParE1/3/4